MIKKSCLVFTIIVMASFTGCVQQNIPTTVNFSYAPTNPTISDTIQFVGVCPNANETVDTWLWDFGDGNTSTDQQPQQQYTITGTYTIRLTIWKKDGSSESISKNIIVSVSPNNPPSSPELTASSISNKQPWIFYLFSASSNDSDGDIISYYFDWGDGTYTGWATDDHPFGRWLEHHSWNSSGMYAVKVKAKDKNDAESEWSELVNVTIDLSMEVPDFTITTIDNENFTLSEHRGKVVIIDFVDMICGWCDLQLDILKNVSKEKGDDIVIISIYVQQFYFNNPNTKENVTKKKEETGAEWTFAVDTLETKVTDEFIEGYITHLSIPTLFVIDKDGYISFSHNKKVEKDELLEEINRIV